MKKLLLILFVLQTVLSFSQQERKHIRYGNSDYEKKEYEKSEVEYKKALEKNKDSFDAAFNLGAFYFNSGADKINESNKLPLNETKKYDALKAEAKKDFEAAVPYVETAHKLKPGDAGTGNMLIKLYTHTGQYDKAKEIKDRI